MVKPINNQAPQSTPTKTGGTKGVTQSQYVPNAASNQNNESLAQQTTPLYNDKARMARRAEHSMSGEAWALKLQQQLDAKNQPQKSGSMVPPRMGWEIKVKHSENSSVPTPYPNIANANQKDELKK
jgi:hypothetical protein